MLGSWSGATVLASALLAAPASAQNAFYVDAELGVDEVGAGSAAQPFRTIGYALNRSAAASLPVQIRVAPGLYNGALGETFPLAMRPRVSVLGAGPGRTVVTPPPDTPGFLFDGSSGPSLDWVEFLPDTQLAGFTLHPDSPTALGTIGIDIVHSGFLACDPTIADVELAGFHYGTRVFSQGARPAAPTVERFVIHGCDVGVEERRFFLSMPGDHVASVYRDGRIRDCEVGISLRGDVGVVGSGVFLAMDRLELTENTTGLRAGACQSFGIEMALRDSLVAGGLRALELRALELPDCSAGTEVHLEVLRSTVVDAAVGLRSIPGAVSRVHFDHTIFYAHGLAAEGLTDPAAQLSSAWSNLPADWPLPLSATDLSVDPLFVDPVAGDWRLRAESPLVDRGDPGAQPGGTDLQHHPRLLDGAGDGVARGDIGALEYSPVELRLRGDTHQGGVLLVQLFAPAHWLQVVAVSMATSDMDLGPLGSLLLDPSQLVFVNPGSTTLPAAPDLAGTELFWQALALDPESGFGATSRRVRLVPGWLLE